MSFVKQCPLVGQSMIVCAFPGTGKSYYCNVNVDYMPQGFAIDSDSSKFDKSNFPENYIAHIKEKITEGYARIFVSSHFSVREALVLHNIPFVLIYPSLELKEEYLERYKNRGNNENFILQVSKNWENWIEELKNQKGCYHIILRSNQFVSQVV